MMRTLLIVNALGLAWGLSGVSLLGKLTRNVRGSFVGGTLPATVNTESNVNDSPVYMRRASIRDARYYTNLAAASFCEDAALLEFSCKPYCGNIRKGTSDFPGSVQVRAVDIVRDFVSGVKGYVAVLPSRREVIVSFASERPQTNKLVLIAVPLLPIDVRGTGSNNTNIRTNAVAVHGVIYSIASRLLDQYRDVVRGILDRTGYTLVFTGHSIGAEVAALSVVAAQRELELPWERIRYFGYGMIRVGNREFVRWINQQRLESTHVVNYDDKVVHLLPRLTNYQHFANEIFIEKDGYIRICDNTYYEDPDCSLIEPDLEFKSPHIQALGTEFGMAC